jgi:hypothetical protein
MTVRAQEHALRRLGAAPLQRSRDAAQGQPEGLLLRINVMEVQSGGGSIVAAQLTPPTRLLDEDLLHASAPIRNPLATAMQATLDV